LRTLVCAVALLLLAGAPAISGQTIRVPRGKPVIIDGKITADEWKDSASSELPGLATLYVKRSKKYVWLALKLKSNDGILDLYLSPADGSIYDLHSSAKLGERRLQNGAWPDWTWWNNEGWVANVSRVESFEKRTFLPTNVRQYQIRRSRFPGTYWKVMFEVGTPAEPEWKVTRYPVGASNTQTKGWLKLRLN
jgi:hypothetical protein